jgi:PAS domain S-box-containing protein
MEPHLEKDKTEQSKDVRNLKDLKKAFDTFTLNTSQLEIAYKRLQKRFKSVNQELKESNQKLNDKVIELNTTTNYLDTILKSISQGIIFVDQNGIIQTLNPPAEKILSVTAKEILPISFWEIFSDDYFGFSMHEALSTREIPDLKQVNISHSPTEEKIIQVDLSFTKEHNTHLKGAIILLRDITTICQLQNLATRHDRLKELGEMAARVAHEIRNPLGGIEGFAALLSRDLNKEPKLKKMADYIVDGTRSLNHLVTCVLDYSRPLEMNFEILDLINIVEQSLETVMVDSNFSRRVQIHTHFPEVPAKIWADGSLVKSVILNLLVNANQAMPEGGLISLSINVHEHHIIFNVKDTGCGIYEQHLEKIFSPFFTTKTTGNGIGLSQVYKIIQALGGTIEVDSTVGQGSTFCIKLPKIETQKKRG